MKSIVKKTLILLIMIAVFGLFIAPSNKVFAAATTYKQTLKSGIDAFPKDYQTALNKIKKLHPNWNFEAYYTGISWDTLVLNETATHGRNRVIKTSDYSWKCSCRKCSK